MFANADLYAPDDAARDANDRMIRTITDVNSFHSQHPTPRPVMAPPNNLVALAGLVLGVIAWARFHR